MSNKIPALSAITTGNQLLPIYPQTMEEVYRIATMALKTGMLPRLKRLVKDDMGTWIEEEEADDAVMARGCMLIMQGMEIGMPPMAALQLMALINGRITVHSEGVPGVLLAKGCKLRRWWSGPETKEGRLMPIVGQPSDLLTHFTEIIRPDGERHEASFSVADAKRASLWQTKAVVTRRGNGGTTYEVENDSPWFRYWQRMMPARSIGYASKDGAADYMKGIAIREEIEDIVRSQAARDVTPDRSGTSLARTKPALDLPDIPDEPANDPVREHSKEARACIAEAISVEMLENVRAEQFPDIDWSSLEDEYEAKRDELEAKGA